MNSAMYFGQYCDSLKIFNTLGTFNRSINSLPAQAESSLVKRQVFLTEVQKKLTNIQPLAQALGINEISHTPYTNPITRVEPVNFMQRISKLNKNPMLSFLRGKYLRNLPLGDEAIKTHTGYSGANLNIIA